MDGPGMVAARACCGSPDTSLSRTLVGFSAGAGRDSSEDTQRDGNDDDTIDGVKNDCVRCTSGGEILVGERGNDGERVSSVLWLKVVEAEASVQFALRDGWRDLRSRCSSSSGSRSSSEGSLSVTGSCAVSSFVASTKDAG